MASEIEPNKFGIVRNSPITPLTIFTMSSIGAMIKAIFSAFLPSFSKNSKKSPNREPIALNTDPMLNSPLLSVPQALTTASLTLTNMSIKKPRILPGIESPRLTLRLLKYSQIKLPILETPLLRSSQRSLKAVLTALNASVFVKYLMIVSLNA